MCGVPPALVLVHGFTQTRQSWRATIAALDGRYRAVAPDLLGHGMLAERRPASLAAELAYLDALVAEPHVLAGYSMGGRIALHAALARPGLVQRLVLVGASPGLADERERAERRAADEALAARIEAIGIEAFAAEWGELPMWEGQPEPVRAAANADRLRNRASGLAAALRGLGTGALPSLWDRLGELTMPVTVVVGDADPKFLALGRRYLETLPDAELVVVPGAGHGLPREAPRALAAAIEGRAT
jgi:2-succinyl-6-hydroxy-2,4-cyclohexadiene-1-carboxylate synthase